MRKTIFGGGRAPAILIALATAFGMAQDASAGGRHFWGGVYIGDPWFWGPPPPAYYYYEGGPRDRGAVKTDVEPEEARVIVDGKDVGEADDFDGFPGYLILRPGRHRLEFRHKGYQTLVLDVTMKPGWLFKVDDDLDRGNPDQRVFHKAGPPTGRDDDEDQPRRRDRDRERDRDHRYDRERQEQRQDQDHDYDQEGGGTSDEQDYDRPSHDRSSTDGYGASGGATIERHGAAASASGRVRFRVDPSDASVYVDGEYVGTASELQRKGGIDLTRGDHTVVVTRDGYDDREVRISVDRGTSSEVNVELSRSRAS